MKKFFRRLYFQLRYYTNPPWDTGISPPELLRFLEEHRPGRALDLGCGSGTNAITLANHGWQTTGVDFVASAIQAARRKARQEGVTVDFRRQDVTRLAGIQGPFDLVLDIGCFHSLTAPGKSAYMQNLKRLLASDGIFLLYAFFRSPDEAASSCGSGLVPADLENLQAHLQLLERQDGSERGQRPSAWFWFKKKSE